MKSAVLAVSALALVAGAAVARPPMPISTSAYSEDGGVVRGPGNQSFDFEAPAYAVGPIEPQNGWSASGVNLPWASVSTANPAGGAQHLRIAQDTTVAQGTQRVALGTNAGALPVGPSTTSVDFNISATGGADYAFIGQAPSQGFLSWRVQFHFADLDADMIPGDILVLDDPDGAGPGGLALVPTGAEYTPGVYGTIRVEANPGADTLQYFLNNTLIYTGVVGIFAGTTVEQAGFICDNWQNQGEVGDFDNIQVTPAPGAIALLGLGGLAAARRRRN